MTAVVCSHHGTAPIQTFGRKSRAARVMALALLVLAFVAPACQTPPAHAAFEPFAPNSPFRTRIPDGAAGDPNSGAMIAWASRNGGINADLVEFGIPIYFASADTPRYTVSCTESWGQCPFDGDQVPIPTGARPHSGSDGAMVVINASTRQVFEFWQAQQAGNRWTVSWAAVTNLDGSGWDRGATASGASRLAGVIRIDEIQRGEIDTRLRSPQTTYAPAYSGRRRSAPTGIRRDQTAFRKAPESGWLQR